MFEPGSVMYVNRRRTVFNLFGLGLPSFSLRTILLRPTISVYARLRWKRVDVMSVVVRVLKHTDRGRLPRNRRSPPAPGVRALGRRPKRVWRMRRAARQRRRRQRVNNNNNNNNTNNNDIKRTRRVPEKFRTVFHVPYTHVKNNDTNAPPPTPGIGSESLTFCRGGVLQNAYNNNNANTRW